MQKLDSKKLKSILKQVENAAKGAVRVLNEQTDGQFKDSDIEKNPLEYTAHIVRALQKGIAQAEENAKYDGLTDDEIADAQAAEREAEKEAIQLAVQEKLAKRQAAAEAAKAEEAQVAEETPEAEPDADTGDSESEPGA